MPFLDVRQRQTRSYAKRSVKIRQRTHWPSAGLGISWIEKLARSWRIDIATARPISARSKPQAWVRHCSVSAVAWRKARSKALTFPMAKTAPASSGQAHHCNLPVNTRAVNVPPAEIWAPESAISPSTCAAVISPAGNSAPGSDTGKLIVASVRMQRSSTLPSEGSDVAVEIDCPPSGTVPGQAIIGSRGTDQRTGARSPDRKVTYWACPSMSHRIFSRVGVWAAWS